MGFLNKVIQVLELGYGYEYLGNEGWMIFYRLPDGRVQGASEESWAYYLEHGKRRCD